MPLDLDDISETRSLLVPAYGYAREVQTADAALAPSFHIGPYRDPDETYGPLHRDDWHVRPRGTASFLFGASALFNDAIGPRGERRIIRLRETDGPKPEDTFNTCLMIQGLRTCARRQGDRSDLVPGYAAWAETGDSHRWISNRTLGQESPDLCRTKTVLLGRSGRGALYAPLDQETARILLIDFRIFDRDEDKPDLLMVWASCTETKRGGIPHQDPLGGRLDDAWHGLIQQAIRGCREELGP